MRRTCATCVMLSACIGLSVVPVLAHHTVASTVDVSTLVSLTGTVTSVDWKNPHVICHLAVPDTNGRVSDWELESCRLQGMHRGGIEQDTIKLV